MTQLLETPIIGDADDLSLAASDAIGLWAGASLAALDREHVWLGQPGAEGLAWRQRLGGDAGALRPALAAAAGGVVAVAAGGDGRLVGALRRGEHVIELERALDGAVWHVALADASGTPWLAVELHRRGERWIQIGPLDVERGTFEPRVERGGGATWARWPAIVAAGADHVVAWCEGPARGPARVMWARLAADGAWSELAPADPGGGPGDAPALAADAAGGAVLAWHVGGAAMAASGDPDASLVRALRVARRGARGGGALLPAPPPGPGGDAPRGEDQGWELPAIAIDRAGAVWLAGRSSHGQHVARFADGAWSARLALAPPGWGGRGRRLALAVHGGTVWLARRAPAGIELGPCPVPPPAEAAAAAPAALAEPAPPAALAEPAPPAELAVPAAPPALAAPARPVPRASRSRRAVLFGDLHQHTAHSDGCGSAEDLWIAARDHRGLDFAAVTDHDRFIRRALGPATWRYLCQVADDFDEPGRFAALPGYEFTGPRHPGPGHKCVYFGDRVPERVPDKDVAAIFAVARELGGIAVPHHVGWTGGDFSHHDPGVQPVWEICSVHGCYECGAGHAAEVRPPRADCVLPGQFVRDALDAGLRFGFIGSTDCHGLDWHHGIAPRRNPFSTGLAAALASEPTREAILAALCARRCYATSGARIELRAEVDGAPMGSDLPAGQRGELAVEIRGTAPVARVVLVTADREQVLGGGAEAELRVRAPLPPATRPGAYFYVRVEQADGELAWSSPFWIG